MVVTVVCVRCQAVSGCDCCLCSLSGRHMVVSVVCARCQAVSGCDCCLCSLSGRQWL